MKIRIDQIIPNPEQPRTVFDEGEIAVLADSLGQHGLLNPIAVEGPYDGYYIVLDGERRVRAARLVGWDSIEAHVRAGNSSNGTGRLLMALVGNLQRADMGPVDEARAYARLRREMSVAEICEKVGRSNFTIYHRLELLDGGLADEVLALINSRRLPSDAKMIRVLRDIPHELQVPLAKRAAQLGMTASRLKGICTRALSSRPHPIHCVQRPIRGAQTDAAPAPALGAAGMGVDDLPGEIVDAIVTTCKKCGMGDDRFNSLCRDCPLTVFIQLLRETEQ